MRRTYVAAIAAVVALFLGALGVMVRFTAAADRYREDVQRGLSDRLGRDVTLGRIRPSLFPIGFTIENPIVGEDPAFKTGRPFAQADAIGVRLRALGLLRGRLDVATVALRRPRIELVADHAGRWNVATLRRTATHATDFALDRLAIVDGHVAVMDLRRGTAPVIEAGVSGDLKLHSDKAQLTASAALEFDKARMRGTDLGYPISLAFEVTSTAGVLNIRSAALRLGRTPLTVAGAIDLRVPTPALDVRVAASDVSLADAARLASGFGLAFGAGTNVDGRLTADVRARGAATRPALDGSLRLRDVGISGGGLPRPVHTDALDLSLTSDEIRSNDFVATANGTSLGARFAIAGYRTSNPTVDASVNATNASVADALNIARAWGVRAAEGVSGTGRVTINVRASGPLEDLAFNGGGRVDDAAVKTAAMTQSARVRHADLVFHDDSATAENLHASIGRTTADGRIAVHNFGAPQVDVDFAADRIDVDEMQRMFASGGTLLQRASGLCRLRAGAVTYGEFAAQALKTTVTLDRGVIHLDSLSAGLFGGRAAGSLVVDVRRTPAPVVVVGTLRQVDANQLATAVANLRDGVSGQLAAEVRVGFLSGAFNMPRTLNGRVSVNIPNARIAHMDLLHEVAAIAQFVGGRPPSRGSTAMTAIGGSFRIADGVAYTDNLMASIEGGRIGGAGSINLVSQALRMRMNVVLSRSFSRAVGGTAVGGFMGTVLANPQGQLVVPVVVTGTMQQPLFAPDVQRIAEMKMTGLATGLLGTLVAQPDATMGESALDAILGTIVGGGSKAPPTAKPAPRPSKDPLEDALRQLLGGKEKKKKPPSRR